MLAAEPFISVLKKQKFISRLSYVYFNSQQCNSYVTALKTSPKKSKLTAREQISTAKPKPGTKIIPNFRFGGNIDSISSQPIEIKKESVSKLSKLIAAPLEDESVKNLNPKERKYYNKLKKLEKQLEIPSDEKEFVDEEEDDFVEDEQQNSQNIQQTKPLSKEAKTSKKNSKLSETTKTEKSERKSISAQPTTSADTKKSTSFKPKFESNQTSQPVEEEKKEDDETIIRSVLKDDENLEKGIEQYFKVLKTKQTKPSELLHPNQKAALNLQNQMRSTLQQEMEPERIQKVLARVGICSRRESEKLIKEGKIEVNGAVAHLGIRVVPGVDRIRVDGREIRDLSLVLGRVKQGEIETEGILEPKLYAFHKTKGYLTSKTDPDGRPTIYDQLQKLGYGHLMYVGRLDMNSEGLLLLTNDGHLARFLTSPESHIERVYLVKVHGKVTQSHLDKLSRGAIIDGVKYGRIKIEIKSQNNSFSWLQVQLFEGKNREIRKVLKAMGMEVSRLIRISYGPYKLTQRIQKNSIVSLPIPPTFLEKAKSWFSKRNNILQKLKNGSEAEKQE